MEFEQAVLRHMPRNMWRTWQRMNLPLSGLVFYAPLWHPELSGSPFLSKDLNAFSCTVTGATWGITGRSFDGDDKITITDSSAILNFTSGNFSIVAWINLDILASYRTIFGRGAYDTAGYWLWVDSNGSLLVVTVQAGSGAGQNSATGNILSVGNNYQVVATRNGASCRLYVNGTDVTTSAGSHIDPASYAGDALISSRANVHYWDGIIGDVLIYNRALSAAEIRQIYLGTKWRYV